MCDGWCVMGCIVLTRSVMVSVLWDVFFQVLLLHTALRQLITCTQTLYRICLHQHPDWGLHSCRGRGWHRMTWLGWQWNGRLLLFYVLSG